MLNTFHLSNNYNNMFTCIALSYLTNIQVRSSDDQVGGFKTANQSLNLQTFLPTAVECAMWHIQYSKYGGQSKGCGPSPNVSLSESSRDSGDDYREKPEGRGARDRETEGQERDTLGGLSILASGRASGRREQLHRGRQGRLGRVGQYTGRSVHTHRESQSNYHLMLIIIIANKYTPVKPSHCNSSDYGH